MVNKYIVTCREEINYSSNSLAQAVYYIRSVYNQYPKHEPLIISKVMYSQVRRTQKIKCT